MFIISTQTFFQHKDFNHKKLKKGCLGCNTEGSLGFLLFSSSSKQRALCWHSSGAWAQASPARGAPLPPAYSWYFQYVAGHLYFCLHLFLCFYNADTPVRNDRSRVIIQAVIESRCFVPNSRSPVVAPTAHCPCLDAFLFFSFLSSLIIFFSILQSSLRGFISADLSKTAPSWTRSKGNKISADCINFTDKPFTTSVVRWIRSQFNPQKLRMNPMNSCF